MNKRLLNKKGVGALIRSAFDKDFLKRVEQELEAEAEAVERTRNARTPAWMRQPMPPIAPPNVRFNRTLVEWFDAGVNAQVADPDRAVPVRNPQAVEEVVFDAE